MRPQPPSTRSAWPTPASRPLPRCANGRLRRPRDHVARDDRQKCRWSLLLARGGAARAASRDSAPNRQINIACTGPQREARQGPYDPPMSDPHDLRRFVIAQQNVYETAARELRAGRKVSHWMWFVFPQIAGLGRSVTSRKYAIGSLAEGAGVPRSRRTRAATARVRAHPDPARGNEPDGG